MYWKKEKKKKFFAGVRKGAGGSHDTKRPEKLAPWLYDMWDDQSECYFVRT